MTPHVTVMPSTVQFKSIQLNFFIAQNQGRNQLWLYANNKIICGRNDGLWRTSVLCILLYRQID